MIILGAGMAGCVAGILNPKAKILEGAGSPPDNHNAVLRFRTDNIGKITGIPFRKALVHKAIWFDEKFYQPNPLLANLYAQKVTGKILSRSIWNIDPVERYVAPPDFHMQMLEMLEDRISYGLKILSIDPEYIHCNNKSFERSAAPIISTIPMPVMIRAVADVDAVGLGDFDFDFNRQPIYTERWSVADCDVYQTIYFPDQNLELYRATLTGSDLILESTSHSIMSIAVACTAFGISMDRCKIIKSGEQRYGKIAPINDAQRKMFMFNLTQELGIYSLGRFACWRNVLLDDVYEDVFKIRSMLNQSAYDMRKEL